MKERQSARRDMYKLPVLSQRNVNIMRELAGELKVLKAPVDLGLTEVVELNSNMLTEARSPLNQLILHCRCKCVCVWYTHTHLLAWIHNKPIFELRASSPLALHFTGIIWLTSIKTYRWRSIVQGVWINYNQSDHDKNGLGCFKLLLRAYSRV